MAVIEAPARTTVLDVVGTRYFATAFLARLPFAMMVVGVLTLIVSARGSLALGGLTSAVAGAGSALVGPAIGAMADRLGQRYVVLVAGAINAVLLLLLAVVAYSSLSDAALLAVAFGVGASAPQVAPMSRSRLVGAIRRHLPLERRIPATGGVMAYESAADEVVFVFGPVLVGVLASLLHPAAPIVAAGLLALVFVTAFALHPTGLTRAAGHRLEQAPARELLRPGLVVVIAGITGVGLFFGTTLTALTSFMADRGAAEQAGFAYGAMGVGSAILALSMTRLPLSFRLSSRWVVFGGVLAAGALVLAVAQSPPMLLAGLALAGIGIGPTLVTIFSLGSERSPAGRSATVMTLLGSGVIVGQASSAAITGLVAEDLGTRAALLGPAIAAAIVLVAALLNARMSAPRVEAPEPEPVRSDAPLVASLPGRP